MAGHGGVPPPVAFDDIVQGREAPVAIAPEFAGDGGFVPIAGPTPLASEMMAEMVEELMLEGKSLDMMMDMGEAGMMMGKDGMMMSKDGMMMNKEDMMMNDMVDTMPQIGLLSFYCHFTINT